MSDMIRVTGMVSGMDTESTVKELMKLEKRKVDKAEQNKQLLQWQKEQYQELATKFDKFQKDFFDITKPRNNLGFAEAFNAFEATSSNDAVSVTATGNSKVGKLTISKISQLATKDRYVSSEASGSAIEAGSALNISAAANTQFKIKLGDNQEATIQLGASYDSTDTAKLISDINSQLEQQFKGKNISAGIIGDKLVINGGSDQKLEITSGNSALGLTTGQKTGVTTATTMSEVLGIASTDTIQLNFAAATGIEIKGEDKLEDVIKKINNSDAGVNLSYDQLSGRFSMEAKKSGKANAIDLSFKVSDINAGKLMSAMKLTEHQEAKDAIFTVKTDSGEMQTTRSSNKFQLEGNNVTLNKISDQPIDIDIKTNTKEAKDKIVKFVDSYNKLLETLRKKTTEKRYRDFAPLTPEQKKELEEEDEKKWQKKAKSGLLRSDYGLKAIATKMRRALYEEVENAGISLKDIGIEGSKTGKLSIKEDKLDKALAEKPEQVIALFTSKSDKEYEDKANASERYKESGIAARLNDIINDTIKTTGKNKGYLIRKAGKSGKIDVSSDLYKKIKESDKKIAKLMEMLARKEDAYYRQFAAMEAAMQRYNDQSAHFAGMM